MMSLAEWDKYVIGDTRDHGYNTLTTGAKRLGYRPSDANRLIEASYRSLKRMLIKEFGQEWWDELEKKAEAANQESWRKYHAGVR